MDSSSTQTLFHVFGELIERRRRPNLIPKKATISCTEPLLLVVRDYALKLGINSDFKVLSHAKNFCLDEIWGLIFGPGNYTKLSNLVESFTQELQEFFTVPKLHQLCDKDKTLEKNELLAVFIIFGLQLLDYETELIVSYEDRIVCLKKELRFLVTVLGDALLLGAELEQANNLLSEFEAVANEAGSLVYSFTFGADQVSIATGLTYNALGSVLESINLLKANITTFSILVPNISEPCMIQKAASVDSLFIVDSLLHDLDYLMSQYHNLIVDVKGQIKILYQRLLLCRSYLKDIKVPQYSEIEELKGPVMRIRDVAYGAEYLINSFLVGDATLWYLTIRLTDVNRKIKLIGNELQEIKESYDNIGVLKVAKDFGAQLSLQAKRNSEIDDITVGFEQKEREILDSLVGGTEHLQSITIFGMPGLGKTTLAKKLYNHPLVDYYFDKRSWCVVSQTYQRKNLLIDILISLGSELDKVTILNMEEKSLAEHIYKSLNGRRYLIIVDDIWDSNAWDDLRRCFPDDGNGSRILFTSRNKDVAPPNSIIYALPSLSSGECWELLERKVFHNNPCPSQLLGVGKKIAANCYGLPLAVVVIAGILSTVEKEESTWKIVGKSLASYIFPDKNKSVMQILKLSYKHLPKYLKPCFLYFGAFPEDREIPVKKLKCLWIAEGFTHKEGEKSPENVAEEYLMELIDKSLVIVAKRRSDGGVKACVVHDLLHVLCLRIAEEENFLKWVDDKCSVYAKHHRLCVHTYANSRDLLPFGSHVRSVLGRLSYCSSLNFENMKLLRVLDVPDNWLSDYDGIELLVNLRYLAAHRMPTSIGSLVNLEFLFIKVGDNVPISSVIQKLVKLRHFSFPLAFFDDDCQSSQTNNLEFLSSISIQTLKDEEILKCSPHLRKLKCNCAPFLDNQGVYRYPDLNFHTELESLNMTAFHGSIAEINFPSNIKKLTLSRLCLPWVKISVIVELPNLQVLKLASNSFVGKRWDTTEGEFQQLRILKLDHLDIAQWNVASSEHFPKLQQLVLRDCRNLPEIPSEVGDILTLQLIEVELCPKSVAESAKQIQQDQQEMGNEELRVIIGDIRK